MVEIKLNYATFKDYSNIETIEFGITNFKKKLIDFIDDKYCGKGHKCVFVAMVGSETTDYFVTDSYLKVEEYFNSQPINSNYFLFEESTFENAFGYCKDHCEVHELGLNQ